MGKYKSEREGQIAFYKTFLPRVNPTVSIGDILEDNNDGVLNGNLLEFKVNITDLNKALFQCVKYLSARRIKGKPVPANILIVDINTAKAWHYLSESYIEHIERPYYGGASKDNSGFIGGAAVSMLRYGGKHPLETEKLIALLKESSFTKININEDCIVGWATEFYRTAPGARKEDFIGDDTGKRKTIGEIRNPRRFADYIYPYTGKSNVKFKYLMDRLNDVLQKKNLEAFYTPIEYVEKALELVRLAIARVPAGNDYIILDRCAGTGNLERYMTDEELSRCVVSTVEYYEYKVLEQLIGSKVRRIIPPTENPDTFNAGLVTGADALSKDYIENEIIKEFVDNPKCTIIIFENPPYIETTSSEHQRRGEGGKSSAAWKNSYVVEEMKKATKGKVKRAPSKDVGNAFIWSGFNYYLRQPTDSYIVFSPVKYWKAQHLVKKQFIKGFAFNRRHFHTNIDACIMCALWANVDDADTSVLSLTGYDLVDGALIEHPERLSVKRIEKIFSEVYYDTLKRSCDQENGIICELNGTERVTVGRNKKRLYADDIVGYMVANGANFDNPDLNTTLLRAAQHNGNGFYLRLDTYLEKLPMFVAGRYITYNRAWTERARIMKSADGADKFARDVASGKLSQFLLKCLLFTCLEMQNHMRTFTGSDGRFYRNELCLDDTNGETIALRDIEGLKQSELEQALVRQWKAVLKYAKRVNANERNNGGYNPALTYGVYQIYAELDTSYKDEITGKTRWDNVELHSALSTLKENVKLYYNAEIVPVLFEYEFLK